MCRHAPPARRSLHLWWHPRSVMSAYTSDSLCSQISPPSRDKQKQQNSTKNNEKCFFPGRWAATQSLLTDFLPLITYKDTGWCPTTPISPFVFWNKRPPIWILVWSASSKDYSYDYLKLLTKFYVYQFKAGWRQKSWKLLTLKLTQRSTGDEFPKKLR